MRVPKRSWIVVALCLASAACAAPSTESTAQPGTAQSPPTSTQTAPNASSPGSLVQLPEGAATDPFVTAEAESETEFLTALDATAAPEGIPEQLGYSQGGDGPACMYYYEEHPTEPTGLTLVPTVESYSIQDDISLCLFPSDAGPVSMKVTRPDGRQFERSLTPVTGIDTSSPYFPMLFQPSPNDPVGKYEVQVTVPGGESVATSFQLTPARDAGPMIQVLNQDYGAGVTSVTQGSKRILIGFWALGSKQARPVRVYRVKPDGKVRYVNTFYVEISEDDTFLASIPIRDQDRGREFLFYLGTGNEEDGRALVAMESFSNFNLGATTAAAICPRQGCEQ